MIESSRGRPGGKVPGSLTWQLEQLTRGDTVLQPSTGEWVRAYVNKCMAAAREETGHEYASKICYAMTNDLDEMPFRFFRITRTR